MKSKRIPVILFIISFFFATAQSLLAASNTDEAQKSGLKEFAISTGWAYGDLKTQDDYQMVPLYVEFGFDANAFFEKINFNPPGDFLFVLEPFINTIVSPSANAEAGLDFLLKYRHPITKRIQAFTAIGAGLMYTSQHTFEQGTQFNFCQQGIAGISFFFADDKAFNIAYRFRHFSNAGIKDPNAGIDMKMILAGISVFF